jgi:hypothetical protein
MSPPETWIGLGLRKNRKIIDSTWHDQNSGRPQSRVLKLR